MDRIRRFAVRRSLFPPVTLPRALERLGFVQADPIRAPARAQDLTLRHRVAGYRAGDLERRYASLPIEEDMFINYGFVSRRVHALMHPRQPPPRSSASPRTGAERLIGFVRERGEVHPREADAFFAHGTVTNYWGGSSSATTHMLDDLHYRGWLRVTRRERGIRVYALRDAAALDRAVTPVDRLDALVDVVVAKYAPVPSRTLPVLIRRLRYAAPQWRSKLDAAIHRARTRLARTTAGGTEWFWPASEPLDDEDAPDTVRLLAPFDPVVWDRRRFELLWNWAYRFEAYTPAPKRKLGYYALPLLWRDRIVGWGNLAVVDGVLDASFGYVGRAPRERAFARELDAELERLRAFLGLI